MLAEDRKAAKAKAQATKQAGATVETRPNDKGKGKGKQKQKQQETVESTQFSPPSNLGFVVEGDEGYIETAGQNDFDAGYVFVLYTFLPRC